MKLAHIYTIYDIYPIGGIDYVLEALKREFEFEKPNAIAVTYTIQPDVVAKLYDIAPNLRIFCGRWTKTEKVRGAIVSPAQTHFKGIMMWSPSKTVYYIGSSNLTMETAGNYGIIVVKEDSFEYFDLTIDDVNDYCYGDPFLPIFNEIVFRETKGICEDCKDQTDRLWLSGGLLVCERCR